MTSALAHRGPDGQGTLVRSPVALGHTRLSIIDLSNAAAQPMQGADGRLAVIFNGEIVNYRELRAELEGHGHEFRTSSDTEVVLEAYAQWGADSLDRFQGMFAFAVADFSKRILFLARDHVGIKPLFYRTGKGFFAFASELSALRKVHAPLPQGSLESVEQFLRFQYIPAPQTIFHDTMKLMPAHFMRVGFDGRVEQPQRWWRINFDQAPLAQDEAREAVRQTLGKAVKRWLVADVPVGVFLSGGLDSTLVAREAAQNGNALQAFSIGFGTPQKDELPHARQAAKTLNLAHETRVLEDMSLDVLPELLDHYGEPFGDASAIPTWHLSKLASEHVKTVLSGDGGDECFGGYDRYLNWVRFGRWWTPRRRELWRDLCYGRAKSPGKLMDVLGFGPEAWIRFVQYTFYPQRKRLWRPENRPLADAQATAFCHAWENAKHASGMGVPQSMDIETYLPGAILSKVDVAAMYHGLEVRPVLLDRELMELAARLPESLKYRQGEAGKLILQELLLETFPESFVKRRKQGFGIPRSQWLSPGSLGYDMLDQLLLCNTHSPLHDWFESSEIYRHIAMQEHGLDNSQHTWLLLVLALWCDRNPDISFR